VAKGRSGKVEAKKIPLQAKEYPFIVQPTEDTERSKGEAFDVEQRSLLRIEAYHVISLDLDNIRFHQKCSYNRRLGC